MTDNPMINSKLMEILDFMKCCKCSEFPQGYEERRRRAHDQIIGLFRECLPKKKEISTFSNYSEVADVISFNSAITEAEKKITNGQ